MSRRRHIPTAVRPPVERFAYLAKHAFERLPFRVNHVSEYLEIDVKTVRRDIDFMRDRLGYNFRCTNQGKWTICAPLRRIL